ncbi:hypothetical protein JCM11641_007273 [Rhodosporidiobolus odoratus]
MVGFRVSGLHLNTPLPRSSTRHSDTTSQTPPSGDSLVVDDDDGDSDSSFSAASFNYTYTTFKSSSNVDHLKGAAVIIGVSNKGSYESEGREEGEYNFKEMLASPELFVQHQPDMDALSPLFKELASIPVPEVNERAPVAGEEKEQRTKVLKEGEEKREAMKKRLPKTRRYTDILNLTFNAEGDIVLEVRDNEGPAATFYAGLEKDREKRLSPDYLEKLDRSEVLSAAAPEGLTLKGVRNLSSSPFTLLGGALPTFHTRGWSFTQLGSEGHQPTKSYRFPLLPLSVASSFPRIPSHPLHWDCQSRRADTHSQLAKTAP